MTITNSRQVKEAYSILNILNKHYSMQEKSESISKYEQETKKAIRSYYKKQEQKQDIKIVKFDFDNHIKLYALPDFLDTLENAIAYFEEYERIEYIPSMYDCTGQAFTSWYKVFKRHDKFYVYHSVSFDV